MSAPSYSGQPSGQRSVRDLIVGFLASPLRGSSWRALAAILLGFVTATTAFGIVTALFSGGASLLIILVGVPFIALAVEVARLYAGIEIWRMTFVGGRPLIQRPHRPLRMLDGEPWETRLRTWFETVFLDAARWYDVAYVAISLPLAVIEFLVAILLWTLALGLTITPPILVLARLGGAHFSIGGGLLNPYVVIVVTFVVGLLLIPVAAASTRGMAILHRYVVEGLLCISPAEALRRENERLRESRSAAVELEASELRRIERDLHDGAQQRLVMLAIDLSLAEGKVDEDPAAAKTLIAGARDQARQALAEIREVVRGTAPAILLDRGLVAALGAVAGRSTVPTFLDSDLAVGARLPHAVERAAYYVVSEALANIAKHAEATRIQITLRWQPTRLGVWVRDDGRGGAKLAQGGGLAGLRDRVEALDGRLLLHSPEGGPTTLHVELPLGRSAPMLASAAWAPLTADSPTQPPPPPQPTAAPPTPLDRTAPPTPLDRTAPPTPLDRTAPPTPPA